MSSYPVTRNLFRVLSCLSALPKTRFALLIFSLLALVSVPGYAKADQGAELFAANCAACHQADGKGLPGAFPPLAGSDYIKEDP